MPGDDSMIITMFKRMMTTATEQGVKVLGLLLTGSTGQHMAGRNGLA
jgi:hypothetical protein